MKVLVVNCGSSSIKYTFFSMTQEKRLAKGLVECIGLPEAYFKHQITGEEEIKESCKVANHVEAIDLIIKNLVHDKHAIIKDVSEIAAVGHRVVHGGNMFSASVPVNDEVMAGLRQTFVIAPLHNPHHYSGIEAITKLIPGTPQVVVFDTSFHQTIPEFAYMYALPYSIYEKYHIRRYGFHGTSHHYVALRAAAMLNKPINETNLITCHLGNGCSITAVEKGRSVDTSMGFTPLEGLVMGTRCGDIDPAIIVHLMANETLTSDSLNTLLNKKSGLFGISGLTGDMRTILKATASGSERAKLALEMYCYRIKKYIGAYMASMNGADALVFTAGVGENSPTVREKSCQNLENFGIAIDTDSNNKSSSEERAISAQDSKVKVLVIPTNEELMIARETVKVLTKT